MGSVGKALGERTHPEAHARGDRTLQVGVARHGVHLMSTGDRQGGIGDLQAEPLGLIEHIEHVQPQGDGDLIVARSPQVHALARLTEVFHEERFDRRVPVFVSLIEHERTGPEAVGQRIERPVDRTGLVIADQVDGVEPMNMGTRGLDIEMEQLTIEQHIVSAHESHGTLLDPRSGLGPERAGFGLDIRWTHTPSSSCPVFRPISSS